MKWRGWQHTMEESTSLSRHQDYLIMDNGSIKVQYVSESLGISWTETNRHLPSLVVEMFFDNKHKGTLLYELA